MLKNLIIAVYCLAFAVGTVSHGLDIVGNGLFPYTFAPFWMNVFWTGLVIIDPLVIILFIAGRRRAGLVLSVVVMIADVAINGWCEVAMGLDFGIALPLQAAFLGFVLGSVWFVWPDARRSLFSSRP